MVEHPTRLLKNAHLRRFPHSSSLRRTSMYASLFGILGVLHLDVFEQPERRLFFNNLLVQTYSVICHGGSLAGVVAGEFADQRRPLAEQRRPSAAGGSHERC
jgi:hypothetical protein